MKEKEDGTTEKREDGGGVGEKDKGQGSKDKGRQRTGARVQKVSGWVSARVMYVLVKSSRAQVRPVACCVPSLYHRKTASSTP